MKISDILLMCMRNLTRSKSRTFLTVIGVIVGTCAIVVMISIGIGLKASNDAMLAEMGDLTVIEIYHGGTNTNTGEQLVLDDTTLAKIAARPHVQVATPFYENWNLNLQVVAGRGDRYQLWPNIYGVAPGALEALGYNLIEGSYSMSTDKRGSVAVIMGQEVPYQFRDIKRRGSNSRRWYGQTDAIGNLLPPFIDVFNDTITLRLQSTDPSNKSLEYTLVINGMTGETSGKWDSTYYIFMDISVYKELEAAYNKANKIKTDENQQEGYRQVKVKVSDIKHVSEVETYIQGLGFSTYSMEGTRKPIEDQTKKQQVILGCLGAISLVVAAIGIANTMFMSILERTREIGIMKVVGCFVRDIRTAFLIEASTIGLMGGMAGVVLSFFISFLMNTFGFSLIDNSNNWWAAQAEATNVSIIPWWLVIGALVFSTIIGLVSGYIPANRAVKIEALEAIKHE